MKRVDRDWLIQRLEPLISEKGLFLTSCSSPAQALLVTPHDSSPPFPRSSWEILIGVDGSTRDRWSVRKGRQVVLWSIDETVYTIKHPFPACVGIGWREAMFETIQQAIAHALELEESHDAATS